MHSNGVRVSRPTRKRVAKNIIQWGGAGPAQRYTTRDYSQLLAAAGEIYVYSKGEREKKK